MADPWKRVTLRLPKSMLDHLDRRVEARHAPNRSEAIRQCIRSAVDNDA